MELAAPLTDEAMVGLVAAAGGVWYGAAGGMSAYIGFMRTDGTVMHTLPRSVAVAAERMTHQR